MQQVMPRVREGRRGYLGDTHQMHVPPPRPLPGTPPSGAATARRSSTFPARRPAASRSPTRPPHRHPLTTRSSGTPRGPAFPGPGRVSLAILGGHVPSRRSQREARVRDPPSRRGEEGWGSRTRRRSLGHSPPDGWRGPPRGSSLRVSGTLPLPPGGAELGFRGKCTRKLVTSQDSAPRRRSGRTVEAAEGPSSRQPTPHFPGLRHCTGLPAPGPAGPRRLPASRRRRRRVPSGPRSSGRVWVVSDRGGVCECEFRGATCFKKEM
ncbi:proline-rich proteoglycan 2-like [Lynx rufus]|uniref:proline-rich proteoglycan 2-like n=1 Tax=Lynx rufus TaxID=61384 RepID=UPI001F1244EE|nr:proline-rich proteoglycan 2-like [Lynx rufus]